MDLHDRQAVGDVHVPSSNASLKQETVSLTTQAKYLHFTIHLTDRYADNGSDICAEKETLRQFMSARLICIRRVTALTVYFKFYLTNHDWIYF